jgi:4-amino-4-deoxy-L-arabinose transferase-like glycosyltransferase
VRGKSTDPAWVRLSVIALLVVTAVLYLWDLGASGYANSFYSAAVQAGTESWKAFFFGSSDAANFITVDKPPASLWVMGLSARIFGVNSWSILVPQALEGVAAVGLLYLTVRRWFSPAAGLIAGAVFALTPVAVLMFRFNNPDALLVLLLVAAAYAVTRAIEKASPKWLMLAGLLIGTGFLTKMMQAYVVVPAFALAYLIAAAAPFWKRVLHLLAAGVAMFVASAWWVAIVTFWPASDRPYIGGSQNNSILDLIFGYNGFGRITGNETGSVVPGGGAGGAAGGVGGVGSVWGATGIDRMFNTSYGGQISWLLPAALILLVALLVYTFRAKRTDKVRAAVIIWGGWLLLTGLTFSFMSGIIHEYYTVALAPAIGALVGIGVVELWKKRESALARGVLALTLAATSVWAFVLLGRSDTFLPWLRIAIVAVGLVLAGVMFFWPWMRARTVLVLGIAGLLVAMAGPTAYAIDTVATPHQGSIVTAGPVTAGARGGPGGGGPGGLAGRPGGFPGGTTTGQTVPNGTTGGTGAFPGGPGGIPGTQGGTGGAGGAGGLLTSSTSSAEMTAALQANASNYTWAAAAIGSQTASGYQLASGEPVMAIGGFNGSDPTPTLAQFQQYVASGQIHYFIAGGGGPGGGGPGGGQTGGNSTSSQISTWVATNYKSQTIGGTTVYDLTQPVTGGTA